jgi:hypothetical protein
VLAATETVEAAASPDEGQLGDPADQLPSEPQTPWQQEAEVQEQQWVGTEKRMKKMKSWTW